MKKRTIIILSIVSILILAFIIYSYHSYSGEEILFENIIGYQGDAANKENFVIRSEEDWNEMARNFYSHLPEHLKESIQDTIMPEVDFSKEMIIAVFMGVRNTGGYSIKIEKIIEKEDRIEVFIKEKKPSRFSGTTQAITYPSHIVKLLRTDKEVIFR